MPGVGLDPDARRALEVARQAEVGPAILPGDRRKAGEPPDRVVIHHREAPPLARRGVHNPALMQRHAAGARGIGRYDLERRGWELQPRAFSDAEILICADLEVDLIRASRAAG